MNALLMPVRRAAAEPDRVYTNHMCEALSARGNLDPSERLMTDEIHAALHRGHPIRGAAIDWLCDLYRWRFLLWDGQWNA